MCNRIGGRFLIASVVVSLALGGAAPPAQTTFPVRFDDLEALTPTTQASGGLTVSTGTHYLNRIALSGGDFNDSNGQEIIRVETTTTDTTIASELLVVSRSDSNNESAGKYAVHSLKKGDPTVTQLWGHGTPLEISTQWLAGVANSHFTLYVRTGPNQNLVTIFIELVSNHEVTVVELYK